MLSRNAGTIAIVNSIDDNLVNFPVLTYEVYEYEAKESLVSSSFVQNASLSYAKTT